jgi:hypothetical protein
MKFATIRIALATFATAATLLSPYVGTAAHAEVSKPVMQCPSPADDASIWCLNRLPR